MGQNKKRIEISLQHLNFLIRKSLADLRIHHGRLMEVLLRIRNAYGIEDFERYKTRALVSLVVMLPEQSAKILIRRFFSKDGGLGQNVEILSILQKSALELASHPEKFPLAELKEYKEEGREFYFKETKKRYFTREEIQRNLLAQVKSRKLVPQTRVWGDQRLMSEQRESGLRALKGQDLLVINNFSQKPYLNQFNMLCNFFFYPLIIPLQKPTYMPMCLKNPKEILANVIIVVTSFLR